MKLLIILPAYNEAANIVRVIETLKEACPNYEYLVVNDGSKDATAAICREAGYPLLDLPTNLGLAGAFQAGMKYADRYNYDAAVQFDADGQHRPEYLSAMLQVLEQGNDIVIGSRFVGRKKPVTMRMLGSALISAAIRLTTGKILRDPTSGMRMYNRRMIREFATQVNHAPEPDTISYLMRRGARVAEVPVEMDERIAGESYLNWIKSITYMLQMGLSILLVQWFRGGDRFSAQEEKCHVY